MKPSLHRLIVSRNYVITKDNGYFNFLLPCKLVYKFRFTFHGSEGKGGTGVLEKNNLGSRHGFNFTKVMGRRRRRKKEKKKAETRSKTGSKNTGCNA